MLGRKQSRSKQWIQNGLSLYQVRTECVWGRGQVCVGSKAEQEQAMVLGMDYEMEWHCTLGSQTEQECVLGRRQSQSIKWIQNRIAQCFGSQAAQEDVEWIGN